MSHWLEEAEEATKGKKQKPRSAGFLDRKLRIGKNYEKNGEKYDAFIRKMHELIRRVNALPLAKKQPFGNIDAKFKESRLNNHFYIFKSCRRYEKQLLGKNYERILNLSWMRLFKPSHFKNVRVLYVTVSSKLDQVGLEIKEESLLKQRVVADEELVRGRRGFKDKNRFHEYLNWPIDSLDEEFAMKITDWLAFRTGIKELPFLKNLHRH